MIDERRIAALCRWNSLSGYYLFGETPTILDARTTGQTDTALTNVHEQTHRDLVNNTIYGYVLRRLRELAGKDQVHAREIERSIPGLASKVWTCAEGSATAMEMLTVSLRDSGAAIPAFSAALPADYREAASVFQPLIDFQVPFPPPILFLTRSCMVHAVAEAAADWTLLERDTPTDDFWALADALNSSTKSPDDMLPELARTAAALPVSAVAMLFDSYKSLAAENRFPEFLRKLIHGFKFSLLAAKGVAAAPPPLLDDDNRISVFRRLDSKMEAEIPALPKHQWKDHVLDAEVQVETPEPPFLLPEETVDPVNLQARMTELSAAPGFHRFVNQFFRDPREQTYAVIVQPMTMMNNALDMAQPYLICKGADPNVLRALDMSGLPQVWLTTGFPLVGGGFYDAEFTLSLTSTTFVELKKFSWEAAASVAKSFPGNQDLAFYDVGSDLGLAVAAIHAGRRTVFGITPAGFHPDYAVKGEARKMELSENLDLAAVAIVLIRQSRTETI